MELQKMDLTFNIHAYLHCVRCDNQSPVEVQYQFGQNNIICPLCGKRTTPPITKLDLKSAYTSLEKPLYKIDSGNGTTLDLWFDENNLFHRDNDMPAVQVYLEDQTLLIAYFQHGKLHRINGPAFILPNEQREDIYIDGIKMNNQQGTVYYKGNALFDSQDVNISSSKPFIEWSTKMNKMLDKESQTLDYNAYKTYHNLLTAPLKEENILELLGKTIQNYRESLTKLIEDYDNNLPEIEDLAAKLLKVVKQKHDLEDKIDKIRQGPY